MEVEDSAGRPGGRGCSEPLPAPDILAEFTTSQQVVLSSSGAAAASGAPSTAAVTGGLRDPAPCSGWTLREEEGPNLDPITAALAAGAAARLLRRRWRGQGA